MSSNIYYIDQVWCPGNVNTPIAMLTPLAMLIQTDRPDVIRYIVYTCSMSGAQTLYSLTGRVQLENIELKK